MSNHEGDRTADDGVFSAFPQQALGMDGLPCSDAMPGLSRREHAAITLRVPSSGTPWIDDMIREARRWDAAERIVPGLVNDLEMLGALKTIGEVDGISAEAAAAKAARSFADALLSALKQGGE